MAISDAVKQGISFGGGLLGIGASGIIGAINGRRNRKIAAGEERLVNSIFDQQINEAPMERTRGVIANTVFNEAGAKHLANMRGASAVTGASAAKMDDMKNSLNEARAKTLRELIADEDLHRSQLYNSYLNSMHNVNAIKMGQNSASTQAAADAGTQMSKLMGGVFKTT